MGWTYRVTASRRRWGSVGCQLGHLAHQVHDLNTSSRRALADLQPRAAHQHEQVATVSAGKPNHTSNFNSHQAAAPWCIQGMDVAALGDRAEVKP